MKTQLMNDPITGIAVGAGTASVSVLSWLEYSGTVFGAVGAFFGCLTAIGAFYHFVVKEIERKPRKKAKKKAQARKKA